MKRQLARLVPVAALAAVFNIVLALRALRRDAEPLTDKLYLYGNTLSTHEESGLSWRDFNEDLGRLEVLLLAGLLALVAVSRSRLAIISAVVTVTAIFADCMTRLGAKVDGRWYFAMCDDALISMRYARNFAAGRGLVYNVGEWVDGFSNPLWTFVMAIPLALGMHEGTATFPILVLGLACLLGAALLAYGSLRRFDVPAPLAIFAFFAVCFDGSTLEFALTGLETTALSIGAAAVVFGAWTKRTWLVATGLVVLVLSRADGTVTGAMLCAWLVREEMVDGDVSLRVAVRRQAAALAAFAVVAAGLVAWRLALYGYPAPNTAYLKVFSIASRLRVGLLSYGGRGLWMYGLPTLFVFAMPRVDPRVQRARRLVLPVLAVWVYAMYVGGDAFIFMRFVGPVTPLLWSSVALAAAPAWEKWSWSMRGLAFLLLALAVPVKSERGVIGVAFDRAGWLDDCLISAKSLQKNVPPTKTIGTFYAGFAYYAPDRSFIDLLGKTERHIAHEETIHGLIPGHNKYDFAYAYTERKPDVTFTARYCHEVDGALRLPLEERAHQASLLKPYIYHAPSDQLLDPTFLALYAPNRVRLREGDRDMPHRLGCWFVREGSNIPTDWQLTRQ